VVTRSVTSVKPKKCAFAQQKVTYLGHVISEEGISVDPTKIKKIWTYPTQNNLKSLCQFLGKASYHAPLLQGCRATLCPHTKNTPFV